MVSDVGLVQLDRATSGLALGGRKTDHGPINDIKSHRLAGPLARLACGLSGLSGGVARSLQSHPQPAEQGRELKALIEFDVDEWDGAGRRGVVWGYRLIDSSGKWAQLSWLRGNDAVDFARNLMEGRKRK